MEEKADAINVGIRVKVIDTRSVECARAADYAVNFIALLKQEVGQVTSILPGDSRDERFLHVAAFALPHSVCRSK